MLADESAARAHAQALASAIAANGMKSMLTASVVVTNNAGEQVLKLPVRAAERN
jgi:hypothetical protein